MPNQWWLSPCVAHRHGPDVLEQRLLLHPDERVPGLVFTSDMTGLVAALEILGPSPEGIVYLLDDEAEDVFSRRQEDFFHSCVHFWARFQPRLPKHFKAQIAERPDPSSSEVLDP